MADQNSTSHNVRWLIWMAVVVAAVVALLYGLRDMVGPGVAIAVASVGLLAILIAIGRRR